MTKNIGKTDKVLRLTIAALCVISILAGAASGTAAWILGAVAVALTATSLVSFCGLYAILGITTCKTSQ